MLSLVYFVALPVLSLSLVSLLTSRFLLGYYGTPHRGKVSLSSVLGGPPNPLLLTGGYTTSALLESSLTTAVV